jgi:hypothetical protein
MKKLATALPCILMLILSGVAAGGEDRVTKQRALDEACELARENKLTPLRQQYIEECVEIKNKERAYCERFYSDYGAKSGQRAPLFYDLPECVEAFEYRRSYREAK